MLLLSRKDKNAAAELETARGLTHAEAVVIYLSTGATAPISVGAGAMPSITDAGFATKLVRSTTPMRLGL